MAVPKSITTSYKRRLEKELKALLIKRQATIIDHTRSIAKIQTQIARTQSSLAAQPLIDALDTMHEEHAQMVKQIDEQIKITKTYLDLPVVG